MLRAELIVFDFRIVFFWELNMVSISLAIVIPTYNSGKYLNETIGSLSGLRLRGASVLAVDSGSSDGTIDILTAARIPYKYCPPGNMYNAINVGFEGVDANWLTYINSDDLLCADNVVNSLILFDGNCDCIFSSLDYINQSNEYMFTRSLHSVLMARKMMINLMPVFPQPGTIFSAKMFSALGGFDGRFLYAADYDYFLRGMLLGMKFCFSRGCSHAKFRVHDEQLSKKGCLDMERELFEIAIKNNIKNSAANVAALKAIYLLFNACNYINQFRVFNARLTGSNKC